MPATCQHLQRVKLTQERVGRPFCIRQPFLSCTPDSSLSTTLVQTIEQDRQRRPKVQYVMQERCTECKLVLKRSKCFRCQQSNFDVIAMLLLDESWQKCGETTTTVTRIEQRLAMVGKRDGNEARARQPTLDPAKNNTVSYGMRGSGCRENDWLVSIGDAQRMQPCRRMKNRCARMRLQELLPTGVLNRINAVNFHDPRRELDRLARLT